MTAAMEASAAQQLAAMEDRVGRLRRSLDGLTRQRAELERDLARAIADGAPAKERRELSDAVGEIDREGAGIPDAIRLLDADVTPLREAVRRERQAKAEAEVDRLDRAFTESVHVAHAALQTAAITYLECHRRMHVARASAVEARRASLRLAGADQQDVFHAEPSEPILGDDGDFFFLATLLARYGAAL